MASYDHPMDFDPDDPDARGPIDATVRLGLRTAYPLPDRADERFSRLLAALGEQDPS